MTESIDDIRSLRSVLSTPADVWLSLRTLGWMTVLPILKRVLPLPRLVRLMWRDGDGRDRQPERERRTTRLVTRLCRTSGGNCLGRSLILYRYLAEAGADPELVVGMGKSDVFLGHAWVTVDGVALVDGSETLEGFAEFARFGGDGKRIGS